MCEVGKRLSDSSDAAIGAEAQYLQWIEQQACPRRSATAGDNVKSRISPPPVPHPQRIGQYEILEPLGQGGMGQVFRARHTKLNKIVAIKIIRPSGSVSQTGIARFEREMQAVGQLDHPNVVRGLDAGQADGVSFLSMELVDGVDLAKVADQEVLSVADSCEIIRQVSLGLQFVHDRGLIHRDIKPSNLILCRDPLGAIGIKILDLGLAMIGDENLDSERLTGAGDALGTLRFMSPEQVEDTRAVDHRADIYSLGATIYRLLVGTLPFSGSRYRSAAKYIRAITTEDAPSIARARDDLPAELSAMIDRMLARDPQHRPADLREVIGVVQTLAQPHRLGELLERIQRSGPRRPEPVTYSFRPNSGSSATLDSLPDDSWHAELGNIGILLQRVKKFWIDGVLERSMQGQSTLALPKEIRPSAVWNPWEGVAELEPDDVTTTTDLSISELFEDSNRSLLILGNPGAGKTTTLLELTRDLVATAERDASCAVPVVLHLSTWNDQTELLESWIEAELSAKYQVPRRVARHWLDQRRLILLLDGLDEVDVDLQSMCMENINQFIDRRSSSDLVVCCRQREYDALRTRLKLTAAVELKPLNSAQIVSSIDAADDSHASLGLALQKHEALRDLATSPLMLSVIKLTYQQGSDESTVDLDSGTLAEVQQQLFATYVNRMFRRKSKPGDTYSQEQTVSRLQWLARRMDDRRQSVFMIEGLQPSWLGSGLQRAAYGISLGIILGLASALVTIFFWSQAMIIMDTSESMSASSLLWFLIQIPAWYLLITALDFAVFRRPSGDSRGRWWRVIRATIKTFVYWTLWMAWPIAGWYTGLWSTGWIVANVMIGIMIGPMLGALGGDRRVMVDVAAVESLGVSAKRSLQGWGWGLLVGYVLYWTYLLLWALYLLEQPPDWFPSYWHSQEELYVSISWPLLLGAVGLVVGGLTPRVAKGKTTPNQGMRLSLRNAAIAALFSSVIVSLTTIVVLQFWLWLPENTLQLSLARKGSIVLAFTTWISFFAALSFGGLDLLKHLLIRLILKATGQVPSNLIGFLDHATRLSFLQRVGGSYMFGHRLLLEHFAKSSKQVPPDRS